MHFVAFPERKDAIFSSSKPSEIDISVSGSIGIHKEGKCVKTDPKETLNSDERLDWCSNIVSQIEGATEKPWIAYSVKGKTMRLTGYSIRNGCCWETCCCTDEGGVINDVYCCCRLYSFSLLGSNDNKTWKVLHRVEKDQKFRVCEFKTYKFETNEPCRFVRFVSDEPWPNCPFCIQINQIEFYGDVMAASALSSSDSDEDDETVSIIGRLGQHE
jgi:hypothetical protein